MIETRLGYKYDKLDNIHHEQIIRVVMWHINDVRETKTLM